MVITELKQTCPRCRGSGHQPGFTAMGIAQINYDGRCPACQGRGFQLTEVGRDLLNLLRPFIEEMIRGDAPGSAPLPKPGEPKERPA
jgi:Tryptophan RNA-binding attenuator protein inhibitory protein